VKSAETMALFAFKPARAPVWVRARWLLKEEHTKGPVIMPMNAKSSLPSLSRARAALARLSADQRGASFVEYVIVVGLIAIVCIVAFGDFGTAVEGKVQEQTNAINNM
jgi:Flp pilus assembly pilin Flp